MPLVDIFIAEASVNNKTPLHTKQLIVFKDKHIQYIRFSEWCSCVWRCYAVWL